MDCALGLTGKDFVMVATDCTVARSIVAIKHDEDKIYDLDETKVLATAGDQASRTAFAEYVQKNMALFRIRNDLKLSNHAASHWIRRTLAQALRSRQGAFQCNSIFAGVDETGPSLVYLDYLGSHQPVDYTCQGYCGYFALAIMDKQWRKDISLEEGRAIMKACIEQLKIRFLVHLPKFQLKIVTKDGISVEYL